MTSMLNDDTAAVLPAAAVPLRSKTITWHDPHELAAAGRTLSGQDFISQIARRILPAPPIAELFGMTIESVAPGDVVFRCEPDESTYNPIGVVHGGLACVLLDTVAGCAVHTTLPAGVGYTSLELKVNYLRPIHGGIPLVAHGWVTKPGRRVLHVPGDGRIAHPNCAKGVRRNSACGDSDPGGERPDV